VVRDVFRAHGLDVSFMAKPIEGVAGSGEHTHIGVSARLKNGKTINLFAPKKMEEDFLNPIGFGALMGILKNYEVINPFIASSNDALNRLKPGFEAPVCIVTSLGHSAKTPSRNRTVLVGLIRDIKNPLSTRFELRSPNPKSNTYLVLASSYLAMLDGITAAVTAQKTPKELESSLSKEAGAEDFYLEKDRAYRSEKHVFDEYTEEEREQLFGKAPITVWETLQSFHNCPDKIAVLLNNDSVIDRRTLDSYEEATLAAWATELHNRIIPNTMDLVRECRKLHADHDCTDFDMLNWKRIQELRVYLGQDEVVKKSLLTRIKLALDGENYDEASALQIEMQGKVKELVDTYIEYKKNLL
jgi:glutamine synthetase